MNPPPFSSLEAPLGRGGIGVSDPPATPLDISSSISIHSTPVTSHPSVPSFSAPPPLSAFPLWVLPELVSPSRYFTSFEVPLAPLLGS